MRVWKNRAVLLFAWLMPFFFFPMEEKTSTADSKLGRFRSISARLTMVERRENALWPSFLVFPYTYWREEGDHRRPVIVCVSSFGPLPKAAVDHKIAEVLFPWSMCPTPHWILWTLWVLSAGVLTLCLLRPGRR